MRLLLHLFFFSLLISMCSKFSAKVRRRKMPCITNFWDVASQKLVIQKICIIKKKNYGKAFLTSKTRHQQQEKTIFIPYTLEIRINHVFLQEYQLKPQTGIISPFPAQRRSEMKKKSFFFAVFSIITIFAAEKTIQIRFI